VTLSAYSEAVSCLPATPLRFHIGSDVDDPVTGAVTVYDVPTGAILHTDRVTGPTWTLRVPPHWPSSLYRAAFSSAGTGIADGPDADVHFVVRATRPGSATSVLVSVPFTTWQAYNRAGEPGQSIYYAEEPTRAARVSFDRPGGGPPPERWEHGLMRWLPAAGYQVDYCANTDLHHGDELLAAYRLLIVNGHDEYWSAPMRDSVERFAAAGGNIAFFAGNTCWWQIRLEDDGRTMVCYRDAVTDPMAAVDPAQVTVEWSSAPVNRPENSLTGVSFRRGAGTWGPYMPLMLQERYTARFADHWVFDGTGLADGDGFALGALGYETDAADVEDVDGVPRITGRDGTPASFVVLATADLRHWRDYGQGGAATMGVFRSGAGTVFTAATVNWGSVLHDPVVDRITRNVIDRLSSAEEPGWETIGSAAGITALGHCEGLLFAVTADGELCARDVSGQNLRWRAIDAADGVRCLASPREASHGMGIGLYALTDDGRVVYRPPVTEPAPWKDLAAAPPAAIGLAAVNNRLFAISVDGGLYQLPVELLARGLPDWTRLGDATGAVALTGLNGRLYALGDDGEIRTREPVTEPAPWRRLCSAGQAHALTAVAGRLVVAGARLRWRAVPNSPR
jgi:hypothetical protein